MKLWAVAVRNSSTMTVSTAVLVLTLAAPQAPQVGNFDKVLVLSKVRSAAFKAPQVRALHMGSIEVRTATSEYDAQLAEFAKKDAELEPVAKALAAGQALQPADVARLGDALMARNLAESRWNAAVEAAVTKVIGTIPANERYMLGNSPEVRQEVDNTLSQLRSLSGKEWDRLAQDVIWRLAEPQFVDSLKANAGSSDRGRNDGKGNNQDIGGQKEEVVRQGREYLQGLLRGNPNQLDDFKQRLAASNGKRGGAENNLRTRVREILVAQGAVEALADAVRSER